MQLDVYDYHSDTSSKHRLEYQSQNDIQDVAFDLKHCFVKLDRTHQKIGAK